MSTAGKRDRRSKARPILAAGDRLDQPTFHARYEATPPGTKAELIDGVVHMASPVGRRHGLAHVPALFWLGYYEGETPGVETLDNATTILGSRSEPQPDVQLRIVSECGGATRDEGGYIAGAPELVFEVAKATRYVDLGPKLADYERGGVLEYIVRAMKPDEVLWHVQQDGRLVAIPPDGDGIYRSRIFPGLWLDPTALLDRDFRRLRAVLDLGLATPEHAAFVASLAERRRSSR